MNTCGCCIKNTREVADKFAELCGGYTGDASDQRFTLQVTVSKAAWHALATSMLFFDKTAGEVVSEALIDYNDGGLCF